MSLQTVLDEEFEPLQRDLWESVHGGMVGGLTCGVFQAGVGWAPPCKLSNF